ncbi:2Fe-2S iron-sulfur cluster-binding protein [cf. Phormidesmis sp. LEGE 11477]|uniref:2Fe-2S iron-sulfur cluster-binding protein n=1 Tax=cf. Phormidesmis sp. LEGE 11477 TaxID=1828680 RepID=UPI00188064C3|nr:2Fe-2S iron-sulfur cluster-binding protein [cf. Phormidesmis sp. LEGE 11477]MBE9061636.1 2Fe-2S iron-sulfur cluster binding domain-containing protein [cf. Phormidesmis sp. LEGE 11477]
MGNTFTAEVLHQGTTHKIEIPDDKPILETLQAAGLELPFSCSAGVCTTCAALVTEGTVDQSDGMGVSPELQADGYALLCVALPTSDLKLETEKEDEVYARQFGR